MYLEEVGGRLAKDWDICHYAASEALRHILELALDQCKWIQSCWARQKILHTSGSKFELRAASEAPPGSVAHAGDAVVFVADQKSLGTSEKRLP